MSKILSLTNLANLLRGMNGGEVPIDAFPPSTAEQEREALAYLFQAVDVGEKKSVRGFQVYNFRQIGNTYRELGEYDKAIDYLTRSRDLYQKDEQPFAAAKVTIDLGRTYITKGELSKGVDYINAGISVVKPKAPDSVAHVAADLHAAGQTKQAVDLLTELLQRARKDQEAPQVASLLYKMAVIERDVGNFDNARKAIEEAIQLCESLRSLITDLGLRSTYFGSAKRYYEFYIDLLMQAYKAQPNKGLAEIALQASEKERSRNLLDLLTTTGIDLRQGVDPTLLEREKRISRELAEQAAIRSRVLIAKHTEEQAAAADAAVSNLSDQLATVEREIRTKSPRYGSITQPSALSAKETQKLLDPGTVLLEYALGEKQSYLWVVSTDSVRGFELPARQAIDVMARQACLAVTARNRARVNDAGLNDEDYRRIATELSKTLLGPAGSLIQNKRLVIVPDGTLSYLPFAALQDPSGSGPLSLTHEIAMLPSASALARLRYDAAEGRPPEKLLAVFADPVFDTGDPRFSRRAVKGPGKDGSPTRPATRDFEIAVRDVGLGSSSGPALPRLPFSRREANSIAALTSPKARLEAVDYNASKSQVFDSNLENYRIVHFATHGLIDSQHPELSGVVLSLVDKRGNDIDGFLRLQDIYNLKLKADLVVLSACNTALGKEVRGEGLIGLTRGFMYAGAPRVVASLWKVDDAATAALMGIFYRKMLVEQMRPAAALRAAQNEIRKQPRWSAPYYWAPFILQGEWR